MTPPVQERLSPAAPSLSRRLWRLMRPLVLVLALGISVATPVQVRAADKIDEDTELDGRLFGYESRVSIGDKDSTTPLWFVYFFLVVVGCSAMFKTAKRE